MLADPLAYPLVLAAVYVGVCLVAESTRRRQLAFALDPVVERLAFQEFHRQVGRAGCFADLVDAHDVIVLDLRGHLRLAHLPAGAEFRHGGKAAAQPDPG